MVKEDALLAAAHSSGDSSQKLAAELLQQVGQKRYDAWFQRVRFDFSHDKSVRVVVGSSLERDCLRKHFKAEIHSACLAAQLGKLQVEFEVQADDDRAEETAATDPHPREDRPAPSEQQDGLACLVPGEHNQQALALAGMIAAGELTPSPAVFWGPSGCGKTSLLTALRNEAQRRNRKLRAVYLTAEDFTSGFVAAVYARSLPSFRGRHRSVDLLLIDDAHFLLGKEKTLEELQHTLDALAAQGSTVVLASDRSPADLRRIGGELLSRLGGGVSVEVAMPDYAAKRRLVARFADECGMPLEKLAGKQIAGGVIGGAWELRGVVNKLRLHWRLMGEHPTETLVQQAVDDVNRISTPSVKIKDIQAAVCQVFGLESAIIKSNRRTKSVTEPRMLAMWLARKYTQAAWSEIGESFGRRSHSTVISACKRIEQLMDRRASIQMPGGRCAMHEALRQVEARLRTA